MDNAGRVVWNLDAESKGFEAKLKKASHDAKSFANDLNNTKLDGLANTVGDAFGKIGSAIFEIGKKATIALGAGAVAATGFAVKSAASFEQTRIGLENMLGSADKARAVLSEVSDFAASTPFEFPELASSVKQLVAFGFTGEDAIKTMKQLGDVSAAIGTPIGDLSYLMGTLRTQGRAFTIDIRQFAQRGVPIYEYLAKVLKTNEKNIVEMVEAGKIGFPEVQAAFAAMTGEGGKFHGAMAKQSKSLSGLFSTLKDNIGQTARELVGISKTGDVVKGSLFDKLRVGVAYLIENLPKVIDNIKGFINSAIPVIKDLATGFVNVAKRIGDHLGPKVEALFNSFSKLVPVVSTFVSQFILPLAAAVGGALVGALGIAIDILNAFVRVLTPVVGWLNENEGATKALALAIGSLFVTMKVQAAFTAFQAGLATLGSGLFASTLRTTGLSGAMRVAGASSVGAAAKFNIYAAAAAAGFIIYKLSSSIHDTSQKTASASAGLMTWQTALLAAYGPMGLMIAGVSALKGRNDALKHATDAVKASQDAVKLSTEQLANAQLAATGTALAVEGAQKAYNDAVAQYGPTSLEARQAAHNLEVAQHHNAEATKNVKTETQNLGNKQREEAQSREFENNVRSQADALSNQGGVINGLIGMLGDWAGAAASAARSVTSSLSSTLNAAKSDGRIPGHARGIMNSPGGLAIVGERGPELVNLPKGSDVFSNETSRRMASTVTAEPISSSGVTKSNQYHIGTINISSEVDGQRWLQKLTNDQEVVSNGLVPSRGAI